MKTNSIGKSIICLIVFTIIMSIFSFVRADDKLYLGITDLKDLSSPSMGYAIGNPNNNGKKIWNIVKYPSATSNQSVNINAYCVKAGVGFSDVKKRQEYDISYDMNTQRQLIANQNELFNQLINGSYYNKVLALMDLLYYPGQNTQEQKEQLLKNAKINLDEYTYTLTDNDIVAVQQAAVWYFTNHDEAIYDQYKKDDWLYYTLNGSDYSSLADYKYEPAGGEGRQRTEQAQKLYNYLIDEANKNATSYNYDQDSPIVIKNTNSSVIEENDKILIGPFSCEITNNNLYTLELSVENDNKNVSYVILDANKKTVENNDINKVIGREFYIQVSSNVNKLNINFNVKYSTTNKTLWASSSNNQAQPIVVLEKKQKETDYPFEYTVESKDQFDLSLRKFITKINNNNVEVSRVPNVDTKPLIDGTSTTANYYGPKNPLFVKKDDIITYNIRVYNEAQKIGRAIKITDQLPDGVELVSITSGAYEIESYDKDKNIVVFKRTNQNNLPAFKNTSSLSYETLTYTAKVLSSAKSGVMTNVAWISEEYNAADDLTIFKQEYPENKNADRDSVPAIHPDVNKNNMENYKGNKENKSVTPADPNYYYKGEYDDDDFEKVEIAPTGIYNLILSKVNDDFSTNLTGAIFEINGHEISVDSNGLVGLMDINIESESQVDKYVIKEIKAPNGYKVFSGKIELELHYKEENGSLVIDTNKSTIKVYDENSNIINTDEFLKINFSDSTLIIKIKNIKQEPSKYTFKIIKEDKENSKALKDAEFEINGKVAKTNESGILNVADNIDIESVDQEDKFVIRETKAPDGYTGFDGKIVVTLRYKLNNKDQIIIDRSKTTVDIFDVNENKIEQSELVNYELTDNNFILHIKNVPYIGKYSIKIIKEDQANSKVLEGAEFDINGKTAKTDKNGILNVADNVDIKSADQVDTFVIRETKAPEGYYGFDGKVVVELRYIFENGKYVIDDKKTTVIIYDKNDNIIQSSDLIYYELSKDDFVLHIKNCPYPFDLALIKNVYAVNFKEVPERLLSIDVSGLNLNGAITQPANTAIYKQNKNPYTVETGDIVTYRIRVYNEGYQNGYADQITEDIPSGLKFLWSEKTGEELEKDTSFTAEEKKAIKFNQEMLWTYNASNNTVSTDILSKKNEIVPGDNLIKAFGYNDGSKTSADLYYKEVFIMLKVETTKPDIIRNEACITKDSNEQGNEVQDRDSDPDTWVKYEDDEDYDNIKIDDFDLALRKWIMGVSKTGSFSESDYLKNSKNEFERAPVVDTSLLDTLDNNGNLITTAIYNGPKNPVEVTINDYVMYCIRIYNEGGVAGYASLITDHLPPYLEFVDNSFNKEYGWKVSDDGRSVTSDYLNTKLIPAINVTDDGKKILSYVDLPIICRVKNTTQAGYINTNIAEIMKYENENHEIAIDRDSKPGDTKIPSDDKLPTYMDDVKGSYIPGQYDDDDFEKVICQIFDLALKKWVSEVITTVNGKTTVTPTGFSPYDNPEQIAKVEIYRKSINTTKVQFKFGIRVINQGSIAGYAKEVKDLIPQGLKFNPSINPTWTQISDNVVVTDSLANTLLQPGSYADVFITLDWINGSDNLGLKTNWAEISKDWNDKNIPDIDSIPDNGIKTEDDIDDAQVLLSVSTGINKSVTNIIVLSGFLIIILSGMIIIKKLVIDSEFTKRL